MTTRASRKTQSKAKRVQTAQCQRAAIGSTLDGPTRPGVHGLNRLRWMRVDCTISAIESAENKCRFIPKGNRVLLPPQGQVFSQTCARQWAQENNLVLICGRYEGFDERIRE